MNEDDRPPRRARYGFGIRSDAMMFGMDGKEGRETNRKRRIDGREKMLSAEPSTIQPVSVNRAHSWEGLVGA